MKVNNSRKKYTQSPEFIHDSDNSKNIDTYLNKYKKISNSSIEDNELINIITKNNFDDSKILTEIKSKINIPKPHRMISSTSSDNICKNSPRDYQKKNYEIKNDRNKNSGRKNSKKNENDFYHYSSRAPKRPFQKCIEVSSDYVPKEKIENIDDENDKKKEILNMKGEIFMKLKNSDFSYDNKRKNSPDEINNKYLTYDKRKNNIKVNKNINIDGSERRKYLKSFFYNMKNYSKKCDNKINNNNNNKNENKNSQVQNNYYINQKIYARKINTKNYISNNLEEKPKEYELDSKVSDFFISACYDNPQREQYLKVINEKKKQNPDKIVELIIPQFPSNPFMQPYPNLYTPYMNPYMMQPTQFQMQNPMINVDMNMQMFQARMQNNNKNLQDVNNNNSIENEINGTPNPNIFMNNIKMQNNNNAFSENKNEGNILNNNNNNNQSISQNLGQSFNVNMNPFISQSISSLHNSQDNNENQQ